MTLVSSIERKTFNVLTLQVKSHSALAHKRDHYLYENFQPIYRFIIYHNELF